MYHERTKQIDVKLQFIRDEVAKGEVVVSKIHTYMNPANALTKVLSSTKFELYVDLMGVLPKPIEFRSELQLIESFLGAVLSNRSIESNCKVESYEVVSWLSFWTQVQLLKKDGELSAI